MTTTTTRTELDPGALGHRFPEEADGTQPRETATPRPIPAPVGWMLFAMGVAMLVATIAIE